VSEAPIVVTGATGLLGRRLVEALPGPVRIVTRDPARAAGRFDRDVTCFAWDGVEPPEKALRGAAGVVHLAGESVFGGRPGARHRERVRRSRLASTEALVATLGRIESAERPGVLVVASAVGYYGEGGETVLDEDAPAGSGFLARLCVDWEEAARRGQRFDVRVVSVRFGLALAREGGALALMLRAFRMGLGGRFGSGSQWVPWVHADDAVGLLRLALTHAALVGPVNAVAPQPVRNRDLTRALASAVSRPAFVAVPGLALRVLLGELAGEFLDSRRVAPRRAQELGYAFVHETLKSALEAEI
jgi:uncharacterized protein (TIGR01777 family)